MNVGCRGRCRRQRDGDRQERRHHAGHGPGRLVGSPTVALPASSLVPGTASLTASYSGNANVNASADTFTVTVAKAGSTTEAKVKPKKPRPSRQVELTVKVNGRQRRRGHRPGHGQGRRAGRHHRRPGERAGCREPRQVQQKGKQTVTVDYLGSATLLPERGDRDVQGAQGIAPSDHAGREWRAPLPALGRPRGPGPDDRSSSLSRSGRTSAPAQAAAVSTRSTSGGARPSVA